MTGRMPTGRRRIILAVLASLVCHALLILILGVIRPGPRDAQALSVDTTVTVDDGPFLFLDLSSGDPFRERGRDEGPEYGKVLVEAYPSSPPSAGEAPVVIGRAPSVRSPGGEEVQDGVRQGSDGKGGSGESFFGIPVGPRRVVFVVDRSLSMGLSGGLAQVRAELLRCLRGLPSGSSFQVVFYNRSTETLPARGLLPGNLASVRLVEDRLLSIHAEGGTDHVKALTLALTYEPDMILLATDADDLTAEHLRQIREANRIRAVVHTIDVSRRLRSAGMLHALALQNAGEHRRLTTRD